jgi:hypothetical protein
VITGTYAVDKFGSWETDAKSYVPTSEVYHAKFESYAATEDEHEENMMQLMST